MSLYQHQEIRDARRRMYEGIYGSSIYKKFSSLPLPVRIRKFFANRVDDIIEYCGEFSVISILLYALVTGYSGAGVRQASIYLDCKKIVSHPEFEGTMALILPRLYGWYVLVVAECILARNGARKVVGVVKWLKTLKEPKIVRALFGLSPSDAMKIYESERMRLNDPFSSKIASGCVRLHYFATLEKGKFKGQGVFPDASIDLPLKDKGVDLSLLRKTWGIETLTIITNTEPFRMTFDPANQDWLSPLAAYDLSHQFTTPIRIYEPRVSKVTAKGRKIRARFYPTIFFVFSFVKLLLGFPETNIRYLTILYGTQYARFYQNVAKFTRPVNQWFLTGGFLILQLIVTIVILPFFIAYRMVSAAGKFIYLVTTEGMPFVYFSVAKIFLALILGVGTALLWSITTSASTIGAISTFVISLRARGWLVTLASVWWALAEFHSL